MIAVRIFGGQLQFGKSSTWVSVDSISNCLSGLLFQGRAYLTTSDGIHLNAVCDPTQSRWAIVGTSLIEQRYVTAHPESVPIAVTSNSASWPLKDCLDLLSPTGYQSSSILNPEIPAGSIGFTYVLCGGGGGGGNGGVSIGGGGGGGGEFVEGTVLLDRLAATIGCQIPELLLAASLGAAGLPGDRGGESSLKASSNGNPITIAAATGGDGGLDGTSTIGYGPGVDGITYGPNGGLGERSIHNEARSTRDRSIVQLNHYGDGGNGGAADLAGSPGKTGYFAIDFF